ncbi:MAG TPA: 16S rRNA (guanine(527)-N(7))-methyltransferase RsmG [Pyrinomonadaceae bacterium]|jgi:16S rRNA (guanine527-N7)-methyltransferase|nr:16S rRNA (guanine(527)-N(7))-methyltransferase RsmG [Pyrinomonadaceae bacterium]
MTKSLQEFDATLETHAAHYGVELGAQECARLGMYYEHLSKWNARLHLVAPCAPAEFATRHVLESLMACRYMDEGARVCDVGSGGGLPIIPCLVVRPDVRATLVEASTKKAVFLREALRHLELQDRAETLAERFEATTAPEADAVTCRALERFTEMYPRLVGWSPHASRLLFFGGSALGELIVRDENLRAFTAVKMPESEGRFLYVCERKN